MNYGEEIAYWYLRFNGFFPLNNFVVHQNEMSDYRGDADIIAIRFPYVVEKIGGMNVQCDSDVKYKDLFPNDLPIGLICEVKTGPNFDSDDKIEKLFREDKISYVIGRFGFENDPRSIQKEIYNERLITRTNYKIAKVLFSDKSNKPKINDNPNFYSIPLTHARSFLKERIKEHEQKYADRHFFPSNLIQYMIDSVKNES